MIEFFAWGFLVQGLLHSVCAYRHATRDLEGSFWTGYSAAGQALLACGCVGFSSVLSVPAGQGSPTVWGQVVVTVVAMQLGVVLEKRARGEVSEAAAS